MWKWEYNGRSGTVTDADHEKMKRDIAFRRYRWTQLQAPPKKQKAEKPATNDPDADGPADQIADTFE